MIYLFIWLIIDCSSSSVTSAFQKSLGQDDESDLVLNFKEQPHSEQQGCVPGTAQFLPM
jgi:hypothetical protein